MSDYDYSVTGHTGQVFKFSITLFILGRVALPIVALPVEEHALRSSG